MVAVFSICFCLVGSGVSRRIESNYIYIYVCSNSVCFLFVKRGLVTSFFFGSQSESHSRPFVLLVWWWWYSLVDILEPAAIGVREKMEQRQKKEKVR